MFWVGSRYLFVIQADQFGQVYVKGMHDLIVRYLFFFLMRN